MVVPYSLSVSPGLSLLETACAGTNGHKPEGTDEPALRGTDGPALGGTDGLRWGAGYRRTCAGGQTDLH